MTRAADKHYVDVNVAGIAAGLGRKVDELPSATQIVSQPAGTQLAINNLNGSLYASQYVVSGSGGIANALATADCAPGCNVHAEQTYNSNESVISQGIPGKGRVIDERGGGASETVVDPINPSQHGVSLGRDL